MSKSETLLDPGHKEQTVPLAEMTLGQRYNCFVDLYNLTECVVEGKTLQRLSEEGCYGWLWQMIESCWGRVLVVVLALVPVVDLLTVFMAIYACCVYWKYLSTHQWNCQQVADPFKNMTFYPQFCIRLDKDYYWLSMQFNDLKDMTVNYSNPMSQSAQLRAQRGQVKTLIYSSPFWAAYHHLPNHKKKHWVTLGALVVVSGGVNFSFWWFVLRAAI